MKRYSLAAVLAGTSCLISIDAFACEDYVAAYKIGAIEKSQLLNCIDKIKPESDEIPSKPAVPKKPATLPSREEIKKDNGRRGYFTGSLPKNQPLPWYAVDEHSWFIAVTTFGDQMNLCREASNLANPVFANLAVYSDKISMVIGSGYDLNIYCEVEPNVPVLRQLKPIKPIKPSIVYVPVGSLLNAVETGRVNEIRNKTTQKPVGSIVNVVRSFRSSYLKQKQKP